MNYVSLQLQGWAAILTLDDPERRNVLSAGMVGAIGDACDRAEADPEVRALVVTGRGSAFCAGAELDTLISAADGDFGPVEAVYQGFLRILDSPLLTVAAVNGPAVGAGFNLALACDLRLAGDRARFDTRFARLHLHPGGGHLWLLQRAVGYQEAGRAVLLSQLWSAEDARRVGLVLDVVPGGELLDAAVELTRPLAAVAPAYARRLVASLRASWSLTKHSDALALETEAQRWSMTQPGFVAGVRAVQASLGRE